MSYTKFSDLEKALGSKVQYIDVKANAEVGFRGIQINGPRGPIRCIPDQNCPSDRAFMLQMDVWKLYSLGKAPKMSRDVVSKKAQSPALDETHITVDEAVKRILSLPTVADKSFLSIDANEVCAKELFGNWNRSAAKKIS